MANPHPHEEDEIPDRTTPQGTQYHDGTAPPYESRDIDLPGILRWFGILIVIVLVCSAFLLVTLPVVNRVEQAGDDGVPVMFRSQPPPPEPRLLPNPTDNQGPVGTPLVGPIEYHVLQKDEENEQLVKLGLQSESGLPVLPAAALQKVLGATGTTPHGEPAHGGAPGTETAPGEGVHSGAAQGDAEHGATEHGGAASGTGGSLVEPRGTSDVYPSDSSGGLATEDRLK